MKIKKILLAAGLITFSLSGSSVLASITENTDGATEATAVTNSEQQATLEVTNAWVRASIPSNKNSVAYMTINNNTDKEYVIIGASSMDTANNVELHKSFVDEKGVSRMTSIDKIVIPAKSSVTMDPGGIHIMLLDLKNNLKVGDKVSIDLKFDGMDPLTIQADVK